MILGEYLAFLALFVAIVPLERLWMSPDRLRPCRRPLILVHGYGCSRGAWWWLRQRLEAAGHVVATVSLAPPNASIGKLEPQLHQRIEEVAPEHLRGRLGVDGLAEDLDRRSGLANGVIEVSGDERLVEARDELHCVKGSLREGAAKR